ncbi:MAG: sulfurtransferase TusA family protein [Thermoanaerobacteraceae bacterium]|uniref:sulfurtransferase TusA family protein n=1 Tax=Thermanaeromonas sp. C210 TaxID=2731925 RepID=UPI00155BCF67|nr:sulfurtransferase TusA family protein [Thermanaeromonas sp. C210]MBE3581770.1 sulfurtransferase TusA family protein [Thermoanaerobacteraceae bacterium]GFN22787.1 recombinase [Thermanaeromonas sp. C210]
MIEIDVRGLSCPIPVVRTKKAMEQHPGQPLLVLTDNETSKENVSRLAESQGYSAKVEKASGLYRLLLEPRQK